MADGTMKDGASLTIVMYHYVRDLAQSSFAGIKGISCERFDGQLDYIARHYSVCNLRDVLEAARGAAELPANACVLTFDDGLMDHYQHVFPRLLQRGFYGSFFPAAMPITDRKVLDAHKIHFVLASSADPTTIISEIFSALQPFRKDHNLPEDAELYRRYAVADRFDPAEVIFIKRVLQKGLPSRVRGALLDTLFQRLVTEDEAAFASELYMDVAQLRSMAQQGLEIGGHGYKHVWLEGLTREEQQNEIARTADLLADIYQRRPVDWTLSYPYGSYDDLTLRIAHDAGAAIGVTTEVGLNSDLDEPLRLKRLDTNDVPCFKSAKPPGWTLATRASNVELIGEVDSARPQP
jgi:peptidoglycan/xylan/chitin deacetylase (PgdA/CDA1 family)